jgi:EAL domain-containing protein (putative c-di-GMP-specific phosphodiesterase class I)
VLGHSLDKKVVAEGVETQYQHDFLKSIVCDEMQGHFFSRPLPEHEFEALIFKQFQS